MPPIPLDPPDYWKLRTLTAELERDELQLSLAQSRLAATRARRQALWAALAAQYGLGPDLARPYLARDDDCSLSLAEPGP